MKKITLLLFMLICSVLAQAQFNQNFDAGTTLPVGWTVLEGGGPSTFIFGAPAGGGNSAPNCAFIGYDAVAHNDYLVTPQIVVTAGVSNRLTFFVKNQDPANVESYEVKVSTTTATAAAMSLVLLAEAPAPNSWTQVSLDLTPYIGQSIYIGFHAVSTDKFRLQFDDIVNDALPSCIAPTAGLSAGITATQANLSWTSTNTNFEVLVQLASAAAPAPNAPDGAGVNVAGNSYVATLPTANSLYSFYVRTECSVGLEYSTWAGPFNFNNITTPNCAVLATPLDAATDVPLILVNSVATPSTRSTAVVLTWTAPATPVAGYRIFFGTVLATLPVLNGTGAPFAGTAVNITNSRYNTTYYWKIVPELASGVQATNCVTYSFTTGPSPGFCMNGILAPVATYTPAVCDGVTANVITPAPIFAGRYSNVNLVSGQTYIFGSSVATDFFSLSKDSGLTAAGFGPTPYTWTSNFTGAVRVYAHTSDQCGASLVAADLRTTTVICVNNLAVSSFDADNFKSFPNPVKDVLNLSYDKNISNVSIINLLGQEVLSSKLNKQEAKIDMSSLNAGAYMVKVTSENEVKTIKVIKE